MCSDQITLCLLCSLLEGKSGVKAITRFDATTYPTNFAAQIENFDHEGYELDFDYL